MDYPFPVITKVCPICGRACGAIYRGYYRRWVICPQIQFMGWMAIRTGYCKDRRRRFALFPDFLIPFRGFSRVALLWLFRAWRESAKDLTRAVDQWFSNQRREVYLSLSTLYSHLRFMTRQFQAGHVLFEITPFSPHALSGLSSVPISKLESAILHPGFGCVANSRIDPPP